MLYNSYIHLHGAKTKKIVLNLVSIAGVNLTNSDAHVHLFFNLGWARFMSSLRQVPWLSIGCPRTLLRVFLTRAGHEFSWLLAEEEMELFHSESHRLMYTSPTGYRNHFVSTSKKTN